MGAGAGVSVLSWSTSLSLSSSGGALERKENKSGPIANNDGERCRTKYEIM